MNEMYAVPGMPMADPVETVQAYVATKIGLPLVAMRLGNDSPRHVAARGLAMWLCCDLGIAAADQVGEAFGCDERRAREALRRVEHLARQSREFATLCATSRAGALKALAGGAA